MGFVLLVSKNMHLQDVSYITSILLSTNPIIYIYTYEYIVRVCAHVRIYIYQWHTCSVGFLLVILEKIMNFIHFLRTESEEMILCSGFDKHNPIATTRDFYHWTNTFPDTKWEFQGKIQNDMEALMINWLINKGTQPQSKSGYCANVVCKISAILFRRQYGVI